MLLSNSCDIALENKRDFPPRIVFAPLIPLQAYVDLLRSSTGLGAEQIDNKVRSIRKQQITSLFFVPAGGNLEGDHIAVLDDLHSVPLGHFVAEKDRVKLFTLSQMGFYLFLLTL